MSSIPEKGHPELTPFLANLFSVIYTSSYVGILYLSHLTRPQPGLARDTPFVIRARIRAVTVVTIVALINSALVAYFYSPHKTYLDIAAFLGIYVKLPLTLDILRCLLLTATLFLGPLVRRLWLEDGWQELKGDVGKMFTTWIGWRNYVAVSWNEIPPSSPLHYYYPRMSINSPAFVPISPRTLRSVGRDRRERETFLSHFLFFYVRRICTRFQT